MAIASRAFSDQLLLALPVFITLLLLLLQSLPALSNIAYFPEFLIISLFFWRIYYPGTLSYTVVFGLGLIYDFMAATPPGSYAMAALITAMALHLAAPRILRQAFRIVWLIAALFILLFLLLAALMNAIALNPIAWPWLLKTAIASIATYPLWHGLFRLVLRILPAGKSR
jgi:rod shape-determining protein MreD